MATGNKAWISGHLLPSSGYFIWLTIPLDWGIQGGALEAFWPVYCRLTARVKDEMTLQLNRNSSYNVGTWNLKLFLPPSPFLFVPFVVHEALWQMKRALSPISVIIALSPTLPDEFCFLFSRYLKRYFREKLKLNKQWSRFQNYRNFLAFFLNNKGDIVYR